MARRITATVKWPITGHEDRFERREWETQEGALESYFQRVNKCAQVYRKGSYFDRKGEEWQAFHVYPYGHKWENVYIRVRDNS